MSRVKICAVITAPDLDAVSKAARLADFFELRIDLVGKGWPRLAAALRKPWIATNRKAAEGGKWQGSEAGRIAELLKAVELGADIVDIELNSKALTHVSQRVKGKAKCLVSHHDRQRTPHLSTLAAIVRRQLAAGADICKVVTTAQRLEDNLHVLKLPGMFPSARIVAFAMGTEGTLSRVMSPLNGAYFTYASIDSLAGSAPGQLSLQEMRKIYGLIL